VPQGLVRGTKGWVVEHEARASSISKHLIIC